MTRVFLLKKEYVRVKGEILLIEALGMHLSETCSVWQPHLVLVPSENVGRLLLLRLAEKGYGTIGVQTMTIRSLAQTLISMTSNQDQLYPSPASRYIAMHQAISQNHQYRVSARLIRVLLQSFTMQRHYGYSPTRVTNLVSTDLRSIFQTYLDSFSFLGDDLDILQSSRQCLPAAALPDHIDLYALGPLTPPEQIFLEALRQKTHLQDWSTTICTLENTYEIASLNDVRQGDIAARIVLHEINSGRMPSEIGVIGSRGQLIRLRTFLKERQIPTTPLTTTLAQTVLGQSITSLLAFLDQPEMESLVKLLSVPLQAKEAADDLLRKLQREPQQDAMLFLQSQTENPLAIQLHQSLRTTSVTDHMKLISDLLPTTNRQSELLQVMEHDLAVQPIASVTLLREALQFELEEAQEPIEEITYGVRLGTWNDPLVASGEVIILLETNEDSFPPRASSNPLLPEELIPLTATPIEHYLRLLWSEAKTAYLIYNAESSVFERHLSPLLPNGTSLNPENLPLLSSLTGSYTPLTTSDAAMTYYNALFDTNKDPRYWGELSSIILKEKRVWSATELETLGTCPYQFLQRYVLRLKEPQEDESFELSALHRGNLIHQILHRVRTTQEPLDAIVTTILGDNPMLNSLKETLLADLSYFLHLMGTVETLASEAEFALPLSLVGGHRITIAGQFDWVGYHQGHLTVMDYKSGTPPTAELAANNLQVPIYMLATAHQQKVSLHEVKGIYASVTSQGSFEWQEMQPFHSEDLLSLIHTLVSTAAMGNFQPKPYTKDACTYCAYQSHCPKQLANVEVESDAT